MFGTLTRRLVEWSRIRRDIRHLKQLDDILLADLGIERDCIAYNVRTGVK